MCSSDLALICLALYTLPAFATTAVSGNLVQDGSGNPLTSGQWCFNSTCLTVTNGVFSGNVTAATSTVTVVNASSVTILSVSNVTIGSLPFVWDNYTIPYGTTFSGYGTPYLGCQIGSQYTQSNSVPANTLWNCVVQNGQLVWQSSVPQSPIGPGIVSGVGVPTGPGVVPTIFVRTDTPQQYSLSGSTGSVSTTWALVGGSGTFNALTGDATSTSTGGATEVIGLLNHALPSLTTGYLNWNGSAWVLSMVSGSGPTIETNGSSNASQSTLNFITSSVNSVGLTITPVNPATTGNERMEITGTYSGTISSSQVTTGLGYTPANCTPGTSGSDCLQLSSGLVPAASFPALLGDVTNTGGSLTTTVGKLENIALPTLAASTGVLYDNNGTLQLATSIASLSGGAVGSAPYQSGANATAFIASPTTSGHTFVYAWQPSGSAIDPVALDLATWYAGLTINATEINGTTVPTSALFAGTNSSNQVVAATTANLASFLSGLTGCGNPGYAYVPHDGQCENISSSSGISGGTLGQIAIFGSSTTITSGITIGNSGTDIPQLSAGLLAAAILPKATASAFGAVEGDGSTVTLTAGVLSCTTATTGQLGCMKPDGSTITISGGVISSTALTNPMTTLGDMLYENSVPAAARLAGPTSGSVPYTLTSTPSGGVAQAPVWALAGIGGRTNTGSTDTIAATDRGSVIVENNASAVAVTLASAATLGSNFDFAIYNENAGTATLTPGAGTINGNSSLAVAEGQNCAINSPDNTNYIARCSSGQVMAGTGLTATPSASGVSFAVTTPFSYPGIGVPNSTGSGWGSSYTVAGAGAGLVTGPTSGTTAGHIVTEQGTAGQIQDSGTLLSSLAPLASPSLTGTPTAPTQSCASNTDIATGAYVAACAPGGNMSTSGTPAAHEVGVFASSTTMLGVGPGAANAPLLGGGASADPAFSSILYPASLTSGGILYGSSTTQLASSALLPAGDFVLGGGAGAAPTATFSTVPVASGGTGQTSVAASLAAFLGGPSAGTYAVTCANSTSCTASSSPGTQTIASGTAAMGTSAIASGACATVVTVSASGVATTDTVGVGFNGDPTAVTGYGASATGAVLTVYTYPTANNVNFKVCNSTASSIPPGSLTLNWRVVR